MAADETELTPSQRRRKKERIRRREDIIKVAESLFLTYGFEQTMMDKIAEEAGFSKATVYKYFNSKDDLYLAVAAKAFQKLCEVMNNALENSERGKEVQTLAYTWLHLARDNISYAEIFDDKRLRSALAVIMEKEIKKQKLTESELEFRAYQQKSFDLLIKGITGTIISTDIKTDVAPQSLALALSSLVPAFIKELVIREKLVSQTQEESEEQLMLVLGLIEKGLKYQNGKNSNLDS